MDDDAARDGLEHLQNAAKEVIAAMRSFLDAAEGVVNDPSAARDAVATLGSIAGLVGRAVRGAGAPGDATSRIEHIEVD